MEENRDQPIVPRHPESQPRRYVYRSVEPDTNLSHPLRRSTDTPREFQGIPGQLCTHTQLLKFRVYMKLN
jgi:hypothetical protein